MRLIRAAISRPNHLFICTGISSIGICAVVSTMAMAYALLMRPVGVPSPEQLAVLEGIDERGRSIPVPIGALDRIRNESVISELCGFTAPQVTVEYGGALSLRAAQRMTPSCFTTLGVRTEIGRPFGPVDANNSEAVVVLSYDAWKREFLGAPDAIGKTVTVDGEPHLVVGVADRRFGGLVYGFPPDLYVMSAPRSRIPPRWVTLLARLPPSISADEARNQLGKRWSDWLRESLPIGTSESQQKVVLSARLNVTPARTGIDYVLRDRFTVPVMALCAMSILLLCGCFISIAYIALSRCIDRRHELSIRLMLGASFVDLAKAAAAEVVVAVMIGSALGLVAAVAVNGIVMDMLRLAYPGLSHSLGERDLAWWVMAVLLLIAQSFCAAAALPYVARLSRSAASASHQRVVIRLSKTRGVLTVVQMATACVLVVGGAFVSTSMLELAAMNLGWRIEGLTLIRLAPLPQNDPPPEPAYYQALLARVATLPFVTGAALTRFPILASQGYIESVRVVPSGRTSTAVEIHTVSGEFFETLGLQFREGRSFGTNEGPDAPAVCVASESLAADLFAARAAVNQLLQIGGASTDQPCRVVGVVSDAVLLEPQHGRRRLLYKSFWQAAPALQRHAQMVVRSPDTRPQSDSWQRVVEFGGRDFIGSVRTAAEQRDGALAEERLVAVAGSTFAATGLAMMAVGFLGLFRAEVSQRYAEIAVRLALGASPFDIARLMMVRMSWLCLGGALVGIPLVWAETIAFTELFGRPPTGAEWTAAALGLAVLGMVAAASFAKPVWAVSRVPPLTALRR